MTERETLTWEAFGRVGRELAQAVADDGYRPSLILAVAAADCSPPGRSVTRWT
jgi:hypoxanthine phosphoribosyltransferase